VQTKFKVFRREHYPGNDGRYIRKNFKTILDHFIELCYPVEGLTKVEKNFIGLLAYSKVGHKKKKDEPNNKYVKTSDKNPYIP
jgi:hypothetical protein